MGDYIIKLEDWTKIGNSGTATYSNNESIQTVVNWEDLKPSTKDKPFNMGIHLCDSGYSTSGYIGVARLKGRNGNLTCENGESGGGVIAYISPRFKTLNPFEMLDAVIDDVEEYDRYLAGTLGNKVSANDYQNDLFGFFPDDDLVESSETSVGGEFLLALSFVKLCEEICKNKLKTQMQQYESNLNGKIKGKILFSKQIKSNIVRGREDKVYCRYTDFSIDTLENKLLKYGLQKATRILNESKLNVSSILSATRYCYTSLERVNCDNISGVDFSRAKTTGLYSNYKKPLLLAKLLCSDGKISAHFESSKNNVFMVMPYYINMEKLFEYYVRTLVKKELRERNKQSSIYYSLKKFGENITIYNRTEQNSHYHLSSDCYPDIWIEKKIIQDDEEKYVSEAVYDVKYKRMTSANREDTHQLLSYAFLLNVDKCGFILPESINGNKSFGPMKINIENNDKPKRTLDYYEYYLNSKKK